jgi:hypothetical protein
MADREQRHLQERERERQNAVAAISEAIDAIEQQQREPDQWERVYLMHALSSLSRGIYLLARTEADLALTPTDERSRMAKLPADPILDECDIVRLRDTLRAIAAEPVRPYQHFGPVIFTR